MSSSDRPDREHYDADEIEAALAGLSAAQWRALRKSARICAWSFRLDPAVLGPEDLLAEVIARTLRGRRRWRRSVKLKNHVELTMRSLASQWRRQLAARASAGFRVLRQSDFMPSIEEDEAPDPVTEAPSHGPDPERLLIAREDLRSFLRHFAGDRLAIEAMAGWNWGLTGPQIEARFEVSRGEYLAAARRIRRYARRLSRLSSEPV